MQEHHDQLSRELEQKIKTLEKEHEDQIRDLNHAHEVEKRNLIAKLRAEINQVCSCECTSVDLLMIIVVQEALGSKHEEERRKIHRQLFETEQQLSALEQKNADLMDTDRNTVNVLKDVEKQHRNETEKLNKQHRLALKKQVGR